MACPLIDDAVKKILRRLPPSFDNSVFITACPAAKGDPSGAACPMVREQSRNACSRRLARFARDFPLGLEQTSAGRARSRWKSALGAGGLKGTPSGPDAAIAPAKQRPRDELHDRLLHHQISWKEHSAGVLHRGSHKGHELRHLFPEGRWADNILPQFRDDLLAHLASAKIPPLAQLHNVMSSQAFALNLMAPFLRYPEKLSLILADNDEELNVVRVEAEVIGEGNPFNEPGGRGQKRTAADIGVWLEGPGGVRELVLLKVKFTEGGFGRCTAGHQHGGSCAFGGRALVASRGGRCPLAQAPHERNYWRLLDKLNPLRLDLLVDAGPCPFRDDGFQLMRTQLLAAAMQANPAEGLSAARFGVLAHDGNTSVRGALRAFTPTATRSLAWPDVVRRSETFELRGAHEWLREFIEDPEIGAWAREMQARYFPPQAMPEGVRPITRRARPAASRAAQAQTTASIVASGFQAAAAIPSASSQERPPAVREGHRHSVKWMGSGPFARLKSLHDEVLGSGTVVYHATDSGVVMISLAKDAPCFVGFRSSAEDEAYLLTPTADVPTREALAARQRMHGQWLQTLERGSAEERAVAVWLRFALQNELRATGFGPEIEGDDDEDWRFLAHEWRLVGEGGRGLKVDLVMLNQATGGIGLVEAKESRRGVRDAIRQVEGYGQVWRQDHQQLATFFKDLARSTWSLYGVAEEPPEISDDPPELFVAWPDPKTGLHVVSVDDLDA